jgi:hypothetical protein
MKVLNKEYQMPIKNLVEQAKEDSTTITKPNMDSYKEIITKHIQNARLKNAIDELLKWAEQEQRDDIVQGTNNLSRRYQDNERNYTIIGKIKYDDYSTERSSITDAVMNLSNLLIQPKPTIPPPAVSSPSTPVSPTSSQTQTILFLAANPSSTGKLRLEEEFLKVHKAIQEARIDTEFDLKQEFFATPDRLLNNLEDRKPNILHFAGHGKEVKGFQQNIEAAAGFYPTGSGIILQDEQGKETEVSVYALDELFSYLKDDGYSPNIVLLNSCYSQSQAQVIAKYVKYVIGTSHTVKDEASIRFSAAFYEGIGKGHDVEKAFKRARVSVATWNLPSGVFVLYANGQERSI